MLNRFSHLSIQQRMFFILGGGVVGFLFYFSVNSFILQNNRETLRSVVEDQIPTLRLADNLAGQVSKLRAAATQAVLTQNFEGLGRVDEAHNNIQEILKQQKNNSRFNKDIKPLFKNYTSTYEQLNELMQNVVAGIETLGKVQGQFQKQVSSLAKIEDNILSYKTQLDAELIHAVELANSHGKNAMIVGLGLLASAALVTILFFMMMFRINKSLDDTNGALQNTSKKLLEMVEEAQVSSSQLRSTATRQASSSTETAVSMRQMKKLLTQTSKVSDDALNLSEASFKEANDGKDIVQSLKDAMAEIERSNTELEEVNDVVKVIRNKTDVINDIVFKTQLLSFNANIEAARAGQHGLGFAVVATEMGNLAEMSGAAAQQINELLDKSADKVETTVGRTKEKIAKANELSAKCYEFFKALTERSGQVKGMVNSISTSAAEQNSGINYVINAMSELNQTAAETDNMAQDFTKLASALKDHALTLSTAVESLNFLVRGSGSRSDEPPTPDSELDSDLGLDSLSKSA